MHPLRPLLPFLFHSSGHPPLESLDHPLGADGLHNLKKAEFEPDVVCGMHWTLQEVHDIIA